MSGQTQPETALQALAEKLRTDAIAIFGEGQSERDIIEWFYGALLAAAPAQGQQVECQERRAALLKVSRDADKLRAELAALKAQQVGQESEPAPKQHPDDAAVDRFAAAMKAKLARSREKGRHGWQNCTAPHLSAMLYDHLYKADPLDVGNFAMMLHQNGQAIELPFEARGRHTAPAQPAAHHIEQALDMVTPAKSEVQRLRVALTQLLSYAERQICAHDNTHRGGAIWEICDDCGAKWADDEGGKPEFKWPNEIEDARAALAASTGQEVEK